MSNNARDKAGYNFVNMNHIDRYARAVLGVFLIFVSPVGFDVIGSALGWFCFFFGSANLLSSVTGWCFMYSLVGLTSLQTTDNSSEEDIALDFKSLRKRAVLGFASISMLVSAMYITEGYQSGKETVQAMELKQLHDITIMVVDELKDTLKESPNDPKETFRSITSEQLIDLLYHFDEPMIVATVFDGQWRIATKKTSTDMDSAIKEAIATSNHNQYASYFDTDVHKDLISNSADLDKYYLEVNGSRYGLMYHDILLSDGATARTFVGKLSNSASYVMEKVFSRLAISSIVVLWISIWGAVAVAYFIWKRVELSNQRTIRAANTDSRTGLLNERALREMFHDKKRFAAQAKYVVRAAKFRNLSQILANNSSIILTKALHQLARRLQAGLGERCTIGSLNDGTFIIIAPQHEQNCLKRFSELVSDTQHVDDFLFSLEPTQVEIHFPRDVKTFDELVSSVSTLIFCANQQRQTYLEYSKDLIQVSEKVLQYSAQIKTALEQRQFKLFLQPKVCMVSRKTIGAEALIRWQHPDDGLLSPFHFLDIVEQSNMRSQFSQFVIEEAANMVLHLQTSGYSIPVSFNLNGYDIYDPNIIETLRRVAQQMPLSNQKLLEIELTESETSIDINHINTQLNTISAMGYSIALDDFGTGMSSFSFTHTLPIDVIKIDRSFVVQLSEEERSWIPIRTILYLAENYGYKVIAEGIETTQQADTLVKLGCLSAQGYLYSKPVPYDEFVGQLQRQDNASDVV